MRFPRTSRLLVNQISPSCLLSSFSRISLPHYFSTLESWSSFAAVPTGFLSASVSSFSFVKTILLYIKTRSISSSAVSSVAAVAFDASLLSLTISSCVLSGAVDVDAWFQSGSLALTTLFVIVCVLC